MADEQGVIFDLDGVLIDSYQAHFESWQALCQEHGLELSQEQFVATFGRTSREVIRQLWGDRVAGEEQIKQLDDRKEALFRKLIADDFPAMDGAVELIDDLYAGGFKLAVGSSAPPENVAVVLDRLQRRERFQAVVSGADVTRGKPDPQVFLLCAQGLGLPPARCLVVEDAPVGVAAARAAGARCAGFASTGRTRESLADADLVIDSLRELSLARVRHLLASHGCANPPS